MKIKNQFGVTAVETTLIVVVALMVVGAGYYVWHRNYSSTTVQGNTNTATTPKVTAESTNSRPACTINKTIHGALFTASNNLYSLCIPDGWQLVDQPDPVGPGQTWDYVFSDASDLVYKSGAIPDIQKATAGKDGPFAFEFEEGDSTGGYFGQPLDSASWTRGTTIQAVNVTGVSYSTVQTTTPGVGLGGIPKGTQQYTFSFDSKNKVHGVGVNYNIFPGDVNQLTLVEQVLATLKFN